MGRSKSVENGVSSSIYIESAYRDLAKCLSSNYSDGDIYVAGIKSILQANESKQAIKKLIELKTLEITKIQKEIEYLNELMDGTQKQKPTLTGKIEIMEYESRDIKIIDKKDFDPKYEKFIREV